MKGIAQVCLSRIVMAAPGMCEWLAGNTILLVSNYCCTFVTVSAVTTPVIMERLERYKFFRVCATNILYTYMHAYLITTVLT